MLSGRSIAVVLVLALLLAIPTALGHAPGATAPAPWLHSGPPHAARGSVAAPLPTPSLGAAAGHPSSGLGHPAATPRNVLVDVPCNSSGNAEVEQAYDPTVGYLYEAWIGCGGIGFSRSIDGGYSFETAFSVAGSTPAGGFSWDPAITLSPNGTIYVAFMVDVPGDAPVVAWSWDHGQTFAGWSLVFTPPTNTFSDRGFIAVAPNGTVYVTWDYSPMANWPNGSALDQEGCASGGSCYFTNGDYNIVIAWSSNGGQNWSGFVPVDPEYPWGGAPCGPLLITPNGTIAVLFEDYDISGADHALGLGYNYFTRSFNGGVNWTAPVRLSNYSFPNNVWWIDGDIAQDNSGTLYATYDSVNATEDTAWVALSRDGGASWSPSIRVNPDVNSAAHNLVDSVGGENGTVYIAWMSNASGSQRAFEAALGGNGSTWGPVTLLSALDGIAGYWIGDTMGLSYLGGGSVAVSWTYGVDQAGFVASQIFAAVVGESPPGPPILAGLQPGAARATLDWNAPTDPEPVTGYIVSWGPEGGVGQNLSVPGTARSATVTNLVPYAHYGIEVTALNAAGLGPSSGPINFSLSAWTRISGSVVPTSASVLLDDVPLPVVGGSFTANTSYSPHVVTAEATDYQSQVFALSPAWNGTVWGNFSLSLLTGTIQGYVSPVTSNVSWRGTLEPVSSNGFFSVTAAAGATGALVVQFPGLIPSYRNLTVVANRTLWENATLTAPNGTLRFHVLPAGAALFVDDRTIPLDAAGNASLSLVGGIYRLEATAESYYPYFSNATLRPGEVANVAVTLIPIAGTPNPNGTVGEGSPNPLADPLVLALIVGVVLLAIAIFQIGRRRRLPPEEAGPEGNVAIEDTEGVEEPALDPGESPAP